MSSRVRILKWGSSLAVRIPVSLTRKLKLSEGSTIHLSITKEAPRAKLRRKPLKRYSLKFLLQGYRPLKSPPSRSASPG
jgi:antitoxin component of MazEF toxin-antitoxin module